MRRILASVCVLSGLAAIGGAMALASDVEAVPTPELEVPALDSAHATFAAVLKVAVKADGVDYGALLKDRTLLDKYRVQLAKAPMPEDADAKKSLFIDAYNAATLALVVRLLPEDRKTWPKWSIRDAGTPLRSVWKKYSFEVASRRYTLDQMENDVLRTMGDPRIHFAINCASRSCPALRGEPYVAEKLDAQLDAATAKFVRSTTHVRIEEDRLLVNPILDWFGADFEPKGGVRVFLRRHSADGPVREWLAADKEIAYFDYDWQLNLSTTDGPK